MANPRHVLLSFRALGNERGQSLVQVMIAAAIGMIVMFVMISIQVQQTHENRALAEKLAANDLNRTIIAALANGGTCSAMFSGSNLINPSANSFVASSVSANQPVTLVLKTLPSGGAAHPVATSPGQASLTSSSLMVADTAANPPGLQVQVTSMSPPSGVLMISFDQTKTVRPIHNLSFPLSFSTSSSGGNTTVTGCMTPTLNMNLQVYDQPGAWSFKVPLGVYRVEVELWGGGGGGCGGIGGAGGGGQYTDCIIGVQPGDVYSVNVGSGGTLSPAPGGTVCTSAGCTCGSGPGGNSSFSGTSVSCIAVGGDPGAAGGGAGGGSTGQIVVTSPPPPAKTQVTGQVLAALNISGGDGVDLGACGDASTIVGTIAKGGASPRGGDGGAARGGGSGPPASQALTPGTAPGGGGPASCWGVSGGVLHGYSGPGAPGAVHVRW